MKSTRILSLAVAALLTAPALSADVTVRYKNEMKMGAGAPPAMTPPATKSFVKPVTVIQIKGTYSYTTTGPFITLTDFGKQVVTLIDPKRRQFATVYMKDYPDQVLSIFADTMAADSVKAQQGGDSVRTTFSSQKTGRTDVILGIRVEETIMTFTANLVPSSDSAEEDQSDTLMKIMLRVWRPLPSEVQRVAALQELSNAYQSDTNSLLNPDAMIERALTHIPGAARNFEALADELSNKNGIKLRTEVEMSSPFLASAFEQKRVDGKAQKIDPNAPIMEGRTEAVEISSNTIDDSVFQVPRDYHVISVPDFVRSAFPVLSGPTTTQPPGASDR